MAKKINDEHDRKKRNDTTLTEAGIKQKSKTAQNQGKPKTMTLTEAGLKDILDSDTIGEIQNFPKLKKLFLMMQDIQQGNVQLLKENIRLTDENKRIKEKNNKLKEENKNKRKILKRLDTIRKGIAPRDEQKKLQEKEEKKTDTVSKEKCNLSKSTDILLEQAQTKIINLECTNKSQATRIENLVAENEDQATRIEKLVAEKKDQATRIENLVVEKKDQAQVRELKPKGDVVSIEVYNELENSFLAALDEMNVLVENFNSAQTTLMKAIENKVPTRTLLPLLKTWYGFQGSREKSKLSSERDEACQKVQEMNEQFGPLRDAYAVLIHKNQQMSRNLSSASLY